MLVHDHALVYRDDGFRCRWPVSQCLMWPLRVVVFPPLLNDELLEAGDMDGASTWKRIVRAVNELLSEEMPNGTPVN